MLEQALIAALFGFLAGFIVPLLIHFIIERK